ncbi:pyridoxamine 5'-phosphate oxidase family protein [Anaerotignum sp.]
MRRKDREVTDFGKIMEIIDRCDCCRVGFCDEGQVYIVPLNFGYTEENGKITLYFHGAKEGRKMELIRKAPNVGFELDTDHKLNEAESACDYSYRFQSIIGNGKMSMIEDMEDKKRALNIVMKHATGKGDWEFDPNMLKVVATFKLEVETLSCKEHL